MDEPNRSRTVREARARASLAVLAMDQLAVGQGSWDVAAESQLCVLEGHTDFVRCAQVSEASPHMLLTGSYDHTVRLWDVSASRSIMTMRFANPVEARGLIRAGPHLVLSGCLTPSSTSAKSFRPPPPHPPVYR